MPLDPAGKKVSLYVCGVTVYDYSHIGHARVYVAFDIMYRYLQHLGYDVTYCRNFTDIDDKIINRAKEAAEDPLALSSRFITEFHKDMELLRCQPPQMEPKATDYVPQMIATITRIMDHGHAYVMEGTSDVYFAVDTLPGYGRLSGRVQDDNRAGERVAVDERKRNPADFALWKGAKPGEPAWPSPWGPGRPGWHIECSSMIRELLGPVIDIHGGGRDLVFPHHENELAQSQAAACCGDKDHMCNDGTDFVRYWVHNGFVTVDSEKMSKSLGNFFTIRDVLKLYHPLAMRWFLTGTQYRQPINYSQRALEEASDRVFYVYQTLLDVRLALDQTATAGTPDADADQAAADLRAGKGPAGELLAEVRGALNDDLNTPQVFSALAGPFKVINELLTTKAGKKRADRRYVLHSLSLGIREVLAMLGMAAEPTDILAELKAAALVRGGVDEAWVASKIAERKDARAAKDFARADQVRIDLAAKGIALMDVAGGETTWRPVLQVAATEAPVATA